MANMMLKLKIDSNLVGFGFGCKSMLTPGVIIAVLVISSNDQNPK